MRHLQTFALLASMLMAGAAAAAQPTAPRAPAPPSPASAPAVPMIEMRNAGETRAQLRQVLDQHPPTLRDVLRLDPSLLSNPEYLGTYPSLAAFVQQHPEVAHNPSFFIGSPEERTSSPQLEAARGLRNLAEMVGVVLIVLTITGAVVFVIKTVIDHRRWQRGMRAQTELNTKLIDRFASSDELLAYLQTPQGRSLTEPVRLPVRAAKAMDAPLGRIFWSLQAGSVVTVGGAGILFAASRMRNELAIVAPTLMAFGTVVLAIGIGFLASAAISYVLSQRLGLIHPLTPTTEEAHGS